MKKFYIASCVFTEEYPQLSIKIQNYISKRFNIQIIRCCVANYKVEEFENRMPEWYRKQWKNIKHYEKYPAGSTMISLCHNCSAIFEERHPEINLMSLWELILTDDKFVYPNLNGEKITIQDCWRSKENFAEQEAVRKILQRMNIEIVELAENHDKTKFCGYSLYQPQPPRNAKLAPKRFVEGAKGLFQEHSQEEKFQLMKNYCEQITTDKIIAYCHYCVRGLKLGGKNAFHLAELLFNDEQR
ncbi:MAG: hypothetical protein IJ728_10390 [Selenomonadaceae bacterium]|nr:hypothetical protein [Selenomonadaceae bacterium]